MISLLWATGAIITLALSVWAGSKMVEVWGSDEPTMYWLLGITTGVVFTICVVGAIFTIDG